MFITRRRVASQVEGVPLVADMSSMILSKPVDVTKYGCIYFGVQKNVAPAGMAIAIVRDDLLGHAADNVPTMMNYTTLLAKDSMYNTPPCWCIYMTGLVLKYLENDIGGLANMQKINEAKAKVLYDYLDGQDFFTNPVEHRYRSTMNVTFTSPNADLRKRVRSSCPSDKKLPQRGKTSPGRGKMSRSDKRGNLPNEVRLRGFYAFSLRNFSMKSTSLSTPSAGMAL